MGVDERRWVTTRSGLNVSWDAIVVSLLIKQVKCLYIHRQLFRAFSLAEQKYIWLGARYHTSKLNTVLYQTTIGAKKLVGKFALAMFIFVKIKFSAYRVGHW